jgi:hypothetical protein
MTEKPPYAIFSPSTKSLSVISRTPGTEGKRPEVTDTLVA